MKKVLIIEDNKDLAHILKKRLEVEGFLVDTAEGGYEVLELLMKMDQPDAIVLDLFLPERSGMELLSSIVNKWPQAKIFIYSAHIEYKDRLALKAYDVAGCFSKLDNTMEELISSIKENFNEYPEK